MNRLLLDSHVVLWWLAGHAGLGPRCVDLIARADRVLVSTVTPWELGIKRALGKLTMPESLVDRLPAEGFVVMPITGEHAERAAALPPHHRDPFDRMLVAQAQLESVALVTADRGLSRYEVELVDAGV